MPQTNKVKESFRQKFGIELTEEEANQYYKKLNNISKGPGICILFMVAFLLFILGGMLLGELPNDKYTYVPLGVVLILILSSASGLQKKTTTFENQFMEEIKQSRAGMNPNYFQQPNNHPYLSNHADTTYLQNNSIPTENQNNSIKKPVPATNCPICNQLIPTNSNPCPKCGSPLLWE